MKKFTILFFIAVLSSLKGTAQCSMMPVAFNDKVSNGSLIVEARVTARQSFWNPEHNYIFTSNLLEVYKVFKGTTISSQIEVITEGGEVDLTRQIVDPSLQLQVGETGIFMLKSGWQAAQFGKQVFGVFADMQGFFKYDSDGSAQTPFATYNSYENDLYPMLQQATGQGFIVIQANTNATQRIISPNSTLAATITNFSPTSVTAGTATSLTITGTGFGATRGTSYVEFANADAGTGFIQPDASQYVSWSNTQIVVQVPTQTSGSGTAGTGVIRVNTGTAVASTQTLTVNYGHLNLLYSNTLTPQQVFNTRHVDLNGMGGITWQMYTGFDANAAAKASFQRAFQTWRCATLINWALGSTVSTNTITFDGVDVIRFDIGSELPAGVLGRCTSYWNGCATGTLVTFFVSELDICFDDAAAGFTWQYGPTNAASTEIDFQSVTVHELGHGHQLSHVINTADVMHYSIANGQTKRTLNTDDVNGGLAVMSRNGTGGVCSKPMMVAISPTACAAGSPTAAFSIAPSATICAGQSITLTDLSAGTPVSWSWTLTGGSPATSTAQNPVVSYATPGTYSITLVSTNGFGSSTPSTQTISVVAAPSVSVSGSTSICSGNSATITASGASSYTWQPGNLTGTSQTFTPAATTPYTVTGSNGFCTNVKTFTITVTNTPTLVVNSATVCSGNAATLTASGATTYTWNPGGLTGATQTFTPPTGTNVYTVTGANGSCISTKTTSILVNATPTVNVFSLSTATICSGKSIAVNATGATSYTWNPGPLTGSSQTLSPLATTVYTINGSNTNCTGTKLYTVTVNATPTITGVTNPTVCVGQTINLTSSGGGTYSWNGPMGYTSGAQNPNIANATTGMAGQYSLTVTSSVGSCTSSATASVTVNALPTASLSSNSPVCSGSTLNLSGSGGSTYLWNGPNSFSSTTQNPSINSVSSAASGTYTLVVTSAASCSASSTVSVTIAGTPTITSSSTPTMICTGQTATITSGGSTGGYTITPGGITTNPAAVNPTVSTTYTVSSTVSGCTGSAVVSLSVSPCTGIENLSANSSLSVYPNPTQSGITVNFGKTISGRITVYNTLGQSLLTKTVNDATQTSVDLSSLAKGMYLLHVSPESGKESIIRVIRD